MKLKQKIAEALEFIFNETVLLVGQVVFNLFTISISLFYAITNTLPVIPAAAWMGICMFMLIANIEPMKNLILPEDDELDEDEVEEPEDEEIVPE